MISIVDYGMGNLRSVEKAFEKVGAAVEIIREPEEIEAADRLVLPGVGAFKDAIDQLRRSGLVEPLRKHVQADKPFLGICLGLQLLFDVGEEDGIHEGLGLVAGRVVKFSFPKSAESDSPKVPHMGWNNIDVKRPAPILVDFPRDAQVYFVHSYYVVPTDETLIATTTRHGREFTSMIWRGRLFATQFHPEKSQTVGLRMLKQFAELAI